MTSRTLGFEAWVRLAALGRATGDFERASRRLGLVPLAIAFVLSGTGCGSQGNSNSGQSSGSSSSGSVASSGNPSSSGSVSSGGGESGSSNPSNSGSSTTGIGGPTSGGALSGSGDTSDEGGAVAEGGEVAEGGGEVAEGGTVGEGGTITTESSCLAGITNYETAGPFKYTATSSGSVKIWVPTVPAGCKVPVIHLANGTGATCSDYGDDLVRFATHGFLATCYEDPNTGAGTDGVTAFTTALAMYPNLAAHALGSTGHSQGGQAAFTTLQLSEAKWGSSYIYAGLAMEPASGFGDQPTGGTWEQVYGKIKSPMFMFSGTADMLVSAAWVGEAYSAMNPKNEVYWWSAIGATHIPTPQVPEEQVSIPWFRWKLLGDGAACKFFKAMPEQQHDFARLDQSDVGERGALPIVGSSAVDSVGNTAVASDANGISR